MPAPSQRRSAVRRSGSSTRALSPEPKQKAATEEIEIEAPEAGGDSSHINAAVSGRSSSVRSTRRAPSATKRSGSTNRKSARAPLTPEEAAKRRAATKALLGIFAGIAVAVIVVAVLVLVVFKKDPALEDGQSKLAQVRGSLSTLDTRVEFDETKKLLAGVPDLPELAKSKSELTKQLTDLEAAVAAKEREARVIDNRKNLVAQLAKLTDPETDLDKLEIDCLAFVKNPVDPSDVPNPSFVAEYQAAVNDIQIRLASIVSERGRRDQANTTGAVQKVQLDVEALVKAEKFAEATALIDDNARKFPKADFGRVRTFVNDSAKSAWTSVTGYVETHYADYAAPGITPSVRQKALEDARARLDKVISTWGIESYVNQAKELRAKY